MEKQQVAQEESLMSKRMTPRALEAAGGSSSSKQSLHFLAVALVAVMGLLIVVLVTAFIYYFPWSCVIASCNQSQEAPPARDPGTFITNCTWKESDHTETYDIFTADDSTTYVVYGWVTFTERTHQELTLIHFEKHDSIEEKMTADHTLTKFFVLEEMRMFKNSKLSLSVPAKLKSCNASRFHVYKK